MLRVRMKTDRTACGMYQREGLEYDLQNDEALSLIRAGQAEMVEVMTVTAPENAARNRKQLSRR